MKFAYQNRLVAGVMTGFLLCSLVLLGACTQENSGVTETEVSRRATNEDTTTTFVDNAGREVTIPTPSNLERIYYTGSTGQIFCFTLAPELAGGSTTEFTEAELAYLPEGIGDLPYLGTLSGGKELNPEAIMAENIQVIFSVTMSAPGESDISEADDLQTQTGIPVVVLDGSLEQSAITYRTLGKLLGKEEAAEELASYCEKTLESVEEAIATIPVEDRITFYYAEGPEGLQTEPEASNHALSFKVAGAKNVADVEATSGKGMSPVSLEQVLAWNPEVIIAWDNEVSGGADELIRTDSNWSTIKAVQDDKVYTMPSVPFSWCDRPPSINRIIGIQWIANTLYPTVYDVDMVEVTKDFYGKFYHCTLTDDQAKEILGSSYSEE